MYALNIYAYIVKKVDSFFFGLLLLIYCLLVHLGL